MPISPQVPQRPEHLPCPSQILVPLKTKGPREITGWFQTAIKLHYLWLKEIWIIGWWEKVDFSPKSTVSTVFVILFYKNFQIRTSQYSCQSSKRCNQTRCWWQKRKVERRERGLLHLSLVVDFQKEMQTFSQFITEPNGFYMSQHMLHSREYIAIVIIKLLPEILACSGTSGTHWSLQSLLSTDSEPLGVLV